MIELVLNLFWIALALPAYYLWRRQAQSARAIRRITSLQCILVLGCVLMLLFPVVSATDDLHFIRPESEESSPTRRALRTAGNDRGVVWTGGTAFQPVIIAFSAIAMTSVVLHLVSTSVEQPRPVGRALTPFGTRAPPAAILL
jgi:nicotinamide riboside transporter PnuC